MIKNPKSTISTDADAIEVEDFSYCNRHKDAKSILLNHKINVCIACIIEENDWQAGRIREGYAHADNQPAAAV